MRRMLSCMAAILCSSIGLTMLARDTAAQGVLANLPRNETLILENPEGTIKNAGWFNIWAINAGSQSNGLQQAASTRSGTSIPSAASTASGTIRSPPRSRSTTPTSPR